MYIGKQIKTAALLTTFAVVAGCTSPASESYVIHNPAIYATQPTPVDNDGNAMAPKDIFPWANGTKGISD